MYEMWVHATRLREPGRARPATRSREPPLSKLTARTKRRLCRGEATLHGRPVLIGPFVSRLCRVCVAFVSRRDGHPASR